MGKWRYSLLLLLANIVYIYLGTMVFIYIEAGPFELTTAKHLEIKQHYMDHLKDQETVLPQLLALQVRQTTFM